jgi:hypothetical protein
MAAVGLAFRSGARISSSVRHETDIRLPYKKYKELYPGSALTYREYKKMQSREAFKTSVPSKQHHRMVR